jgi:hypothetical protein
MLYPMGIHLAVCTLVRLAYALPTLPMAPLPVRIPIPTPLSSYVHPMQVLWLSYLYPTGHTTRTLPAYRLARFATGQP